MDKVKVILFLYFDAQEMKIKNRITDIVNRLLHAPENLSDKDIIELHKLRIELNLLNKTELQIYELLGI